LYIQIPFCKDLCPYCPYNRIKYDRKTAQEYTKALLEEIDEYYKIFGKIEISSIYIGGGTPTNLIDELGLILKTIRNKFDVHGNFCIETTPSDIDEYVVNKLKAYEISQVSLGVQSFQDRFLNAIGRKYDASKLSSAIDVVLSAKFNSVNIDLMFALPGENVKDLIFDLKRAIDLRVEQITAYPLFTFPYSSVASYLKVKKLRMPDFKVRRKMYKTLHTCCINNRYQRVSVWGFKRGKEPRYSSVTRDYYIGLGAGAASCLPGVFYFNTFSVDEYIKSLVNGQLPVAFKMNIKESLARYYWLYWRLYDTYISKKQLREMFKTGDRKLFFLLKTGKMFKLFKENKEIICLTERGSFWIHLIQNYFFLDYVNKIWSVAMKDPWPKRIKI
jgi:oxygen-independent coproporphyrinogen-3 oxidase